MPRLKTERGLPMLDDEEFKIPRAPLTRHDYGLLALCTFTIGGLITLILALVLCG